MLHSSFWPRAAELVQWWVRSLACLAYVARTDVETTQTSRTLSNERPWKEAEPALAEQLEEILEAVRREELRWGRGRPRGRSMPWSHL